MSFICLGSRTAFLTSGALAEIPSWVSFWANQLRVLRKMSLLPWWLEYSLAAKSTSPKTAIRGLGEGFSSGMVPWAMEAWAWVSTGAVVTAMVMGPGMSLS